MYPSSVKLADSLFISACKNLGFDPEDQLNLVKTKNLQHLIIENMFQMIKWPEAHSKLAACMAMWEVYRNCPTTIKEYADVFKDDLREDVYQYMIDHADQLQDIIEFQRDFDMSYFSAGTFIGQYLTRLKYDEEPLEIVQFAWLRVAIGELCSRNKISDEEKFDLVVNIYRRYSTMEISPSSPAIFNMGFKRGAPTSCMIYTIDDDMDDILKVIWEAGLASKNNCGSGIDFSNLRHSRIGRHGPSKGVIPLLRIWDDLTDYIDQGGKRPGATTASLKIHHYDIPEFIRVVDQIGESKTRATKLNTSIMLTDLFLQRCKEGGKWSLFCPKQAKGLNNVHGKEYEKLYVEWEQKAEVWNRYKKYRAFQQLLIIDQKSRQSFTSLAEEFEGKPVPEEVESRVFLAEDLHAEIEDMRFKTGMPYIVHSDNLNRKNNMDNEGEVVTLNLCQEVTIPAIPNVQTGSCNLHTISLSRYVDNKKFNFLKFGSAVQDAVICLNGLIDESHNISDKAKLSNSRNRPVGLGPTGFDDMLNLMDLPVVDPSSVPYKTEDGYELKPLADGTPDYSEEGLLERQINPKVDELNWKIWCCKYYNALLASLNEAKKYGPYETFWSSHLAKGELQYHLWQQEEKETGRKYPFPLEPVEPSEWGQEGSWTKLISEIKTHGIRNSLLLTVMPGSTKSQMVDNVEACELPAGNIYARKVLSGDYPVLNYHMVNDLESIGMWNEKIHNNIISNDGSILQLPEDGLSNDDKVKLRFFKEKYLTMFEVPQKIMLWLSARRQVVIDQAQSINIYLKGQQKGMLRAIDQYTNELGLKNGSYYIRSRSARDPLKFKSVAENQALTQIQHDVKPIGSDLGRLTIQECGDSEMAEIMRIVQSKQDEYKAKEVEIREGVINKTLMSASRPEEAPVCNLGEECVNCQ